MPLYAYSVTLLQDNRSGDRALWTLKEWSAYMNAGTVPQDRMPPPPMTPQHYIFNMSCLEISTTIFARRLGVPFLHRQLDPLCRFEGNLKVDKGNTAGLYFMSSKAGSFSVSSLLFPRKNAAYYLAYSAMACRRHGGSALADGRARDQVGLYSAPHRVSVRCVAQR